jgi:acyl-CoA synthetase (AMP-forming)/AMP-acid ligase II
LAESVTDLVAGRATDVALIEPETGRSVCFDDLRAEIADLAGKLAGAGVQRGDRVALLLPDGPQFVRFLLAVTSLGAAAAPLNPSYTRDEFTFYLEDLAPRVVLTAKGSAAAAREAAPETRFLEVDGEELESLAVRNFESGSADDIALILHTSGTTSRPKQVPLLQRNLVANSQGIANFYALSRDDVSFCVMPLFHVHGLVASVLSAFAVGGAVVVPSRFAPGRLRRYATDNGVTWFSAGPTLHSMILDKLDDVPIPTLRFLRSCSSALSTELLDRCEAVYGVPMVEAYGMTEGSHQIASNPLPPAVRKGSSVGLPSPGVEIRIVDPDGRDVEAGEVAIRGPGLTPGYVANQEANEQSFFDGGWFRTGDRGRFDIDGYLKLEGRLKELIIRGGENISPYEIEGALKAHPDVLDAVAFPIPDDRYGEVVGAAVVVNGQTGETVLRAWCAERLAAFKVPARIFVVPEIQRTATGKLQRARIGAGLLGPDT